VGKLLGRERAVLAVWAARRRGSWRRTLASIAVANASGDGIAQDGAVLGGLHGDRGELLRSAELIPDMPHLTEWAIRSGQSTTLASFAPTPCLTSAAAPSSRESREPGSLGRRSSVTPLGRRHRLPRGL
jgi:hypothetical protein